MVASARTALRSLNSISTRKEKPRVVLLQGPVGPFFRRLHRFLERHGFEVLRICFDAGDRFFACGTECHVYSGGRQEWESWFSEFVSLADPDHVVYLRRRARDPSCSPLRRGSVRSQRDRARRRLYPSRDSSPWSEAPTTPLRPLPGSCRRTVSMPSRWICRGPISRASAACAFTALSTTRFACSSAAGRNRELFHRRFNILHEAFAWVRNYWRRAMHLRRNFSAIERLLEHHHGQYFIVPLQVAADSQMAQAARGWNSVRLIDAVLASFAQHAPDTDTWCSRFTRSSAVTRPTSTGSALLRGFLALPTASTSSTRAHWGF